MALRIISANEPMKVDQLVVTIYGQPGVGKTSLGFTAESPLLLDFDHGAYRAMGRKDTVDVSAWSDVTHIEASDLDGYKTIVVDTAGRALDALAADIIRREPKLGRGGALTQQGWGRLKSEFTSWLTLLRSFGLDVVLIAHGTEKMDGDETIVRLDVAGGSKDEIYKSADMMGRLFIRGGRCMISFDPTDTAYGKNPASLPTQEVPSNDFGFMAGLIADTKNRLNALSEEQQAEAVKIKNFTETVKRFTGPEDFTDSIGVAKELGKTFAGILAREAKERGYVYDQQTRAYKVAA